MAKKINIPNPGSNEAIEQGCTCPVLDNNYGKGAFGGIKDENGNLLFWFSSDCPVHNKKENNDQGRDTN